VEPVALRDTCDRNYTAAFAALIPHVGSSTGGTRSFGTVTAVVTGLTEAFYNPVMVTSAEAAPGDVTAAVRWSRSLGVPASVVLREDLRERFESTVRGVGLEPNRWADPGMALHPIPPTPPAPPELRIEVVDAATFDDWHAGISYGPNFRRVYGPTLIEDPTFRLVVGYVEDQPVAGAAAILTGNAVGIYAVGTAERARRRGFGRAMTWAAIQAGVEAGCSVAVLQSSEMAVSLYRWMGFVEVCRYIDYEPVEGSAGGPASPA